MRSAPTITRRPAQWPSPRPRRSRSSSRCGMPASASSHAVSRAPCSSGRVSSTRTSAILPRECKTRIAPIAVPNAVVASRPVLQCVRMRSGRSGHSSCTRSAAWVAHARLTVGVLGQHLLRLGEHGVGALGQLGHRTLHTPGQVDRGRPGRGDPLRLRPSPSRGRPRALCRQRHTECTGDAERGAPRMARVLIASMSSSTVVIRSRRNSCGSARWSMASKHRRPRRSNSPRKSSQLATQLASHRPIETRI